jgi:hypothetical protein
MIKTPLKRLSTAAGFGVLLASAPARAQSAPPPPVAEQPVAEQPVAERYHAELAIGGWGTAPSTIQYSDTETVTTTNSSSTTGTTTTTTNVVGSNIDFKQQLGLVNRVLPEFHLTVRLWPKHKLRAEFVPLYYKQTAALTSTLNYNGQTYATADLVASSLHWNPFQIGYEYDVVAGGRGFAGGIVGLNYQSISTSLSDAARSSTVDLRIPMPGLGIAGRYYPAPAVSLTGTFIGYDLPGSATNTHGHAFAIDAVATLSLSRFVGFQGGYRSLAASYVWASSTNTGTFRIGGPFLGGVVRY